jgi:8-oxo-dGTP diphosphatase
MTLTHKYEDLSIELTVFEATITEGTPEMLEHCDIRFIFPSEIPQYDFCGADEDVLAEIVRRYG